MSSPTPRQITLKIEAHAAHAGVVHVEVCCEKFRIASMEMGPTGDHADLLVQALAPGVQARLAAAIRGVARAAAAERQA